MDGNALSTLLLPLMVSAAFAGGIYALVYPYISTERQKEKRLESVVGVRARKSGGALAEIQSSRKKSVADTLKDMDERQKKDKKITMRLRMERAGLKQSPRDFYILSATLGIILAGIAYSIFDLPVGAVVVAGFLGAFGIPRWILSKITSRRQQKFSSQLANAIDVIVRGVKSGLPLNECIQVIARESPEPLAGEFRSVVEQQRLGVPIGDGLERMCERMPLAEVRFLSIVISIQQQAGGNLSEALANLSGVLRDRQSLAMKVKALSAEAKASAMVLASLPPGVMFMVYLSSPGYMMPLFTTTMGRFMVGIGAAWMMMGVLVMRKMINFKF
ncbi:type II secretion system F family protein [Hyphomicrobium sp.]|jgi:tight adherence protein B|uniref:type II secretion system F family protein n=1 Tax=Hyphomicrobium sp. TaxID=82 RepID=UPI002D199F84|nr:type II secretion system F family protein [Hyphomicrobium sp.]HVZ03256.1 type II secretion system F family protein [Hyphomicrobium sp.]